MRRFFLLFGLFQVAVLAYWLTVQYWYWDFDDGFIVYRYAENLLRGEGWVFNPGERYNASTSVLNTVLITLIAGAGLPVRAAAHVLGGCSLFVAGSALLIIFYRLRSPLLGYFGASALVWLLGNNLSWGLETNLFIALLLLYAALESLAIESWVLIGLLVLARPDGAVLLALKIGMALARRERFPVRGLARAGAVIAPWVVFSLYYFHQIFPATLAQKVWQGQSGYWGQGYIYAIGAAQYLLGMYYVGAVGSVLAPLVLIVPAALAPQGLLQLISERSAALYFVVVIIAQQVVYSLLNIPAYHWYYGPLGALIYLLALFGVKLLLEVPLLVRLPMRSVAIGGFSLGAIALCVQCARIASQQESDLKDVRTEAYQKLSETLAVNAPIESAVAAVEVGVVGYFSKRPMVDLVGLTTPYGEYVTPSHIDQLYDRLKPEQIVLHAPLMPHEQTVWADPRFHRDYFFQARVHHPGYQPLLIYRRRAAPLGDQSSVSAALSLAGTNHMKSDDGIHYRLSGTDPWFNLESAREVASASLELDFDVELAGFAAGDSPYIAARIFYAGENEPYDPVRSLPVLITANRRATYRIPLTVAGQEGASIKVKHVRLDAIENPLPILSSGADKASIILHHSSLHSR